MSQLIKSTLIGVVSLMSIALLLSAYHVHQYMNAPFTSQIKEVSYIDIDARSKKNQLIPELLNHHLIQSTWPLKCYLKFTGMASFLHKGIYEVHPQDNLISLLKKMKRADVYQVQFRIKDGEMLFQLKNRIDAFNWIKKPVDFSAFTKGHKNAEGLFFPDTYQFDAGSDAHLFLAKAYDNMMQQLDRVYHQRAADLPYRSPYELLIAASVIEKEASQLPDKQMISGVIVNRLKKNMPLQMDPTVVYALGEHYQGRLSKQDLQIDSPYNTYRYKGLPPGPISTVGMDSLMAAAHPITHDYLYFVARGDGVHEFSKTYKDQIIAIKRYLGKSS